MPRARFGCALIDIDEFLFSVDGKELAEKLNSFEKRPAVAVNWRMYGSSHHDRKPNGLTISNFVWRGKDEFVLRKPHLLRYPGLDPADSTSYYPMNGHVKLIVRPDLVLDIKSPHLFIFQDNQMACHEDFSPSRKHFSDFLGGEVLRINHYWSRSREECAAKLARGRGFTRDYRPPNEFAERDKVLNDVYDPCLKTYTRLLNGRIGELNSSPFT